MRGEESMLDWKLRKRDILRLAAGLATTAFVTSSGLAQQRKLFGIKLPKEVFDILPTKPLNLLQTVDTILALEGEADRKGLPLSSLTANSGKPIIASETSLYMQALPRLVALIDRSELADIGLADQAGNLLAELHSTQHIVPEALRTTPLDFGYRPNDAPLMRLDSQPSGDNLALPDLSSLPDGAPDPTPVLIDPVIFDPTQPPENIHSEPKQSMLRSKDFSALKNEYARLFSEMELRSNYSEAANWNAAMIRKSRARYEGVSKVTGVPWHFIAVIHALESSFNFRAHFHNGDFPLSARTRQVPSGRPAIWLPPADWESSAKDALRLLGFTNQKDWSLERTLYRLEAYNGLGYRSYGVPTPYLWSYSNQYDRGKFVADGHFSDRARSQQCGSAVMLKLLEQSGDITLGSAA
jgi:lysozyme family protein